MNERYAHDPIDTLLHIAHTRTNINPEVIPEVDRLNFKDFDVRMLGGDMAIRSSLDSAAILSLQNYFDLSNPSTLWTMGNHDYDRPDLVSMVTLRPTYFVFHKNEITYLVLDSQEDFSKITDAQLEMIQNVSDTIDVSSHLIVLTHKLIWMHNHPDLNNRGGIANGGFGNCDHCINPNNWYEDVYPILKNIKAKGIEVICIAGDIGNAIETFEYTTSDSIIYLASGIKPNHSGNMVLVFRHDKIKQELIWQYKLLNEM